ncbi:MAG TPA: S41 family peptidase [Bacteroidia bacterium]|nr:S41 family peptidase [Bacteroidia bacterium]HRS59724.1 S41 family peptidase [Bacteroidia bacterium]HRU68164.1 S41 family peptidase [Bacteroidia bacterium]
MIFINLPMDKKYNYLLPLLLSVMLAAGMIAGYKFNPYNKPAIVKEGGKLGEVIDMIDMAYVDSVNIEKLTENAIRQLLFELDPHSVYLTKEENIESYQDLQGNFEGIGIEFNILNDTIIVVSPISGGPSEAVGIKAGDKIIYVENELVAGKGISTTDVRKRLLGKKGTQVRIKVLRPGMKNLLEFTITRDKIPNSSIDAAFMIDKTTGYIKINRFSAQTVDEFTTKLAELVLKGMTGLILDLSGNPGGYLDAAIKIADQFLNGKKLIVYTEGRQRKRQNYYSTSSGMFTNGKLVIIIDEGSASASEILAGAIQDWDRGLIVGRRSFGKGLVQEPILLKDSSEIRLTVARYYTPSGRFIQKPYQNGVQDYYMEMYHRFSNGEVFSKDSNNFPDSLKYKTAKGRIVYGGGGIMPDIFVAVDTSANSALLSELNRKGIFPTFSLFYLDQNRQFLLKNYPDFETFNKNFQVESIRATFIQYAEKQKISVNPNQFERSKKIIYAQLKAFIARHLYGNDAFYQIINQINPEFQSAYRTIISNYLIK